MSNITVETYLLARQANLARSVESSTTAAAKKSFTRGYDPEAYRVTLSETVRAYMDGAGPPAAVSLQNNSIYGGFNIYTR